MKSKIIYFVFLLDEMHQGGQCLLTGFSYFFRVLNTDNMSIVGLTIDYGPYGFMDAFDRGYICNGSGYIIVIIGKYV